MDSDWSACGARLWDYVGSDEVVAVEPITASSRGWSARVAPVALVTCFASSGKKGRSPVAEDRTGI